MVSLCGFLLLDLYILAYIRYLTLLLYNVVKYSPPVRFLIKQLISYSDKPNICVEQIDVLPGLRFAAVLPIATKILTEDQDLTFAPLTVNIEHLEDLPLKFLKSIQYVLYFSVLLVR